MINKSDESKHELSQFVSYFSTPVGYLCAWSNGLAITKVGFEEYAPTKLHENDVSKRAVAQLQEYIEGRRTSFDLPLEPIGTKFQQRVWKALLSIPFGHTVSYKYIAEQLHQPTASRAVGMANGKNPIAIIIPCHRVIGANGKLTGYAGGLDRKAYLLDLEQT